MGLILNTLYPRMYGLLRGVSGQITPTVR